jgi:hypothetical protein
MFLYFKPYIIKEIQKARSRISILFNRWGLKREKLSVISVVIHFINEYYENVTRLISLLELLGHGKAGVSKLTCFLYTYFYRYTFFSTWCCGLF